MRRSLLEIINDVLQDECISKISSEMNLRDDLGLDSLNLAYLTVLIEDEYGIDIFEDGIVETIGDIENKLNA